jgi:hypothetical protein
MIVQDIFAVEPWTVPERELHLDLLAQTATRATACISRRWPAVGASRPPASAACAIPGDTLAFAPRRPPAEQPPNRTPPRRHREA